MSVHPQQIPSCVLNLYMSSFLLQQSELYAVLERTIPNILATSAAIKALPGSIGLSGWQSELFREASNKLNSPRIVKVGDKQRSFPFMLNLMEVVKQQLKGLKHLTVYWNSTYRLTLSSAGGPVKKPLHTSPLFRRI